MLKRRDIFFKVASAWERLLNAIHFTLLVTTPFLALGVLAGGIWVGASQHALPDDLARICEACHQMMCASTAE